MLATRLLSNDVYSMMFGVDRRAAILATIKMYMGSETALPGLPVNNKYQWSTNDPDLRYLLKKGKIKRIRRSTRPERNLVTGRKPGGKGQTYLVLS